VTDWVQWHREYDRPNSSLARRLRVVRHCVRRALAEIDRRGERQPIRLVSMCAGDGRDVLPVLATHHAGRQVRALLVELDPYLAGRARSTATRLGLRAVTIRTADAGVTDAYADFAPAHVLLACGVFGNLTAEHVKRTIATLPRLLTAGGLVIWTRGRPPAGPDPSLDIRTWLAGHGFAELSFAAPADARFRVGMHRLDLPADEPVSAGTRIFAFA
jgi:putative methyltransferase